MTTKLLPGDLVTASQSGLVREIGGVALFQMNINCLPVVVPIMMSSVLRIGELAEVIAVNYGAVYLLCSSGKMGWTDVVFVTRVSERKGRSE
jgi:hypothetical protein